jgi:hypothetical protein
MTEQVDLFGSRPGAGTPPRTADHTADRGAGAPALTTAREAVRADAVAMGSANPDSPWVAMRRARSARARDEHAAIGTDHASFFEFTPGSQTIAPRPVLPYEAFDAAWYRRKGRAEESYAGLTDQDVRLFAMSRSVRLTRAAESEDTATHGAEVDLFGDRFSGRGRTLVEAIDALAACVRRGPAGRSGPTPAEGPRAPSALEVRWAAMSPELRAAHHAYCYFDARKRLFTASRARDLAFRLTDDDLVVAAAIGVASVADDARGAATAIVEFFRAVDRATQIAELDHWEGLTSEALPGEAIQRTDARVARIEGIRVDRYIDAGASIATAAHHAVRAEARDADAELR